MRRVVLFIGVLVAVLLLVLTFLTFARGKKPGATRFGTRFYSEYFRAQGDLAPGRLIRLKDRFLCFHDDVVGPRLWHNKEHGFPDIVFTVKFYR